MQKSSNLFDGHESAQVRYSYIRTRRHAMSKKVLTNEEIGMLRSDPYTHVVTPRSLSFTKECRELFWNEYQVGVILCQILEPCGYPQMCWVKSESGKLPIQSFFTKHFFCNSFPKIHSYIFQLFLSAHE